MTVVVMWIFLTVASLVTVVVMWIFLTVASPVAVIVMRIFRAVPWIGLQYVILVFPGHTHSPFLDSDQARHFAGPSNLFAEVISIRYQANS